MLEVITPAEETALTTLAAVKAELGITGTDQDDRLGALIDQYSAVIVAWCGRPFALETVRETIYEPRQVDALMLQRFPVVSVASVEIDGALIAPEGYAVDRIGGIVHRRSPTRCGPFWPRGETVIEYQAGYILPDDEDRTLPHDIERAAIMLVKSAHFATARDPALRSEETDGVATFQYFGSNGAGSDGMPLEVQGLLSGYRAPGVA